MATHRSEKSGVTTGLLVAFGVSAIVGLVVLVNAERPDELAHMQHYLSWLTPAVGLFVATVAALFMLIEAIAGDRQRVALLALPALVGAMLIGMHWSIPLAVAILGTVALVQPTLNASARRGDNVNPE